MKLGVQLPNIGPLEGREPYVRIARAAEELGYDSVWSGDHVVYPVESRPPYPSHPRGPYSPASAVSGTKRSAPLSSASMPPGQLTEPPAKSVGVTPPGVRPDRAKGAASRESLPWQARHSCVAHSPLATLW